MSEHHDLDRDLDRLVDRLPEILRDDWVVLPKNRINMACAVSLLLGAAITLMIVGFVLDIPTMKWAWPLVVGGLMLATRLSPWWRGDRCVEQLRRATAREDSG